MRTFATDMVQLLEDNGFGVGYDAIYNDFELDNQERITVFTVGAQTDVATFNPQQDHTRPMVRISAYSTDGQKAQDTIYSIIEFLKGQASIDIGDTHYCFFNVRNDVNFINKDNNNRVGYWANIGTIRR